ncbi:D-alanyl-D-alanine dipeptidase [Kordiimonas sediminis]|uniref:D-alanyl-D-alanine dipeptidase n=1 Tax=Kordiimonas sediminis TaxID=1735581 RepID=A0A919AQ61_9PROT|nr:M15 family metallopeptidase [Kordiimonas sediminis]GHF18857.1 D-alanyl-D-alanine dipeptidase [Kordiimonas sediminis]
MRLKHLIGVVGVLMMAGSATMAETEAVPDAELVDLGQVIPGLVCEARYFGNENFIGEQIDGYLAPKCLLTRRAAQQLAYVQKELEAFGMTLVVFDGYRPQLAVDHFVRWAADLDDTKMKTAYYPNVPKSKLFEEGYIAAKSGHSRASTIDLSIGKTDKNGGYTLLEMGTPFDFFDVLSHGENPDIPADARGNRLLLRSVMMRHGFKPYSAEWWHFTLENEPFPTTYFTEPVE